MAQGILRIFNPELVGDKDRCIQVARFLPGVIFEAHYPGDVESRTEGGLLVLRPGDITLATPVLDSELSESDADYELEASEGSGNWPRPDDKDASWDVVRARAEEEMLRRAEAISLALRVEFPGLSHNVFEVSGLGTGFVQYNPDEGR